MKRIRLRHGTSLLQMIATIAFMAGLMASMAVFMRQTVATFGMGLRSTAHHRSLQMLIDRFTDDVHHASNVIIIDPERTSIETDFGTIEYLFQNHRIVRAIVSKDANQSPDPFHIGINATATMQMSDSDSENGSRRLVMRLNPDDKEFIKEPIEIAARVGALRLKPVEQSP